MPDMGEKLNKLIATKTKEILESKGYKVTLNDITQKYDPKNEVKKIVDNDCIIFQYHIWWFNIPWEFKKWIYTVFMVVQGILWANDERTSSDSNKKYMLSTTWNEPVEAFNSNQFLENKCYIKQHA